MKKELTHRSHELKALGWNQEDLTRYEDLWDYSQRWGLINLEREDRQFLKRAEKLLPKIQNKKISVKKTIEEKSYYLWLNFYLDEINIYLEFGAAARTSLPVSKGTHGRKCQTPAPICDALGTTCDSRVEINFFLTNLCVS